jgi:hypothetical protein
MMLLLPGVQNPPEIVHFTNLADIVNDDQSEAPLAASGMMAASQTLAVPGPDAMRWRRATHNRHPTRATS